MGVLIAIAVIAMLGGAFFYNPLRRKMAGIVGVGGSYLILIGIMLLITCIAMIFGGEKIGANGVEIVVTIIFMVLTLGYMVFIMITRCNTVMQKIMLPFAAILIGMGFAWRLLALLILHIPMENGKTAKTSVFPRAITSPEGERFTIENEGTDIATYYCARTGARVQFRDCDFDEGYPTGWYSA